MSGWKGSDRMTEDNEEIDWYDLGWSHGYDDQYAEYSDNEEYMKGYEQGCMDC